MNDEIVLAAVDLFKMALYVNHAELALPLTECAMYYTPMMYFTQLTYWTEEVLVLFYRVDNKAEYDIDSLDVPYKKQKFFVWPFDETTSPMQEFRRLVAGNLKLDADECGDKLVLPTYHVIEPELFVRMLKLFAFS